MSRDWQQDIRQMHDGFFMTRRFEEITQDKELSTKLLEFRLNFIQEELDEAKAADNPEDVLDALIDIIVVALGTADAFGCNTEQAWDRVLNANLTKVPGIKPERPNPLGLPDLMKPEGWTAPDHKHLTGKLDVIFS